VQVEQKQQEKGDAIALHLYVFYLFNIKEDVSMDLGEAKQHAQNLQVAVVLDILVCYFSTTLAFFKAVVIVLKLTHNF
jgi:hypothetical protein